MRIMKNHPPISNLFGYPKINVRFGRRKNMNGWLTQFPLFEPLESKIHNSDNSRVNRLPRIFRYFERKYK